jgi:hypothetical protein
MFFDPRPVPPWQRRLYGKWGLVALLAAFLLVGTTGHDPWRGADLRHFFAVWQVLQGQWLLPSALIDGTVPAAGPLYYWVAALLGLLLEPFGLALHDATRFASPLLLLCTLLSLGAAALPWCGKPWQAGAMLVGLGTLGWVLDAHQHQALLASAAAIGLALAAVSRREAQPAKAWIAACIAMAAGFLAQGFALLLVLSIPWLATWPWPRIEAARRLPLLMVTALIFALPAMWLAAVGRTDAGEAWLALQAPQLSQEFIASNLDDAWRDAAWVAWPLWLLALWPLRRAVNGDGSNLRLLAVAWAMIAMGLVVVTAWPPSNPSDLLILLPPLTLLATERLRRMPSGARAAFSWFSAATVLSLVVFAGLSWSAWNLDWPPGLARHMVRVAPEFEMSGSLWRLGAATAVLLTWFVLAVTTPPSPLRPAIHWALGVTLAWVVLVLLLEPWFEHTRNLRPIVEQMQGTLRERAPSCVSVPGREADVRAALVYFGGIPATLEDGCPVRFARLRGQQPLPSDGSVLWSMTRGQGKRLEYWLLLDNERARPTHD